MGFKAKLKELFGLCPVIHIVGLGSALIILLHFIFRNNHELTVALSERIVQPFHHALAQLNSHFTFSLGEVIITLGVIIAFFSVFMIVYSLIRKKYGIFYKAISGLISLILLIYAGFCLLWGVYYYGDDFIKKSGFKEEKISVEELTAVTEYFSALANEYSGKVERDADGVCASSKEEIIKKSSGVYDNIVKSFPCLSGPDVQVKPIYFSKALSYLDFTGFFFPFTAEANVNIDSPCCYFASTVAHESAHQRGVAQEGEANFVAVMAALDFGDADYVYSAALLAYTHLGNALHDTDYPAWKEIYNTLNADVLKDLENNRTYWANYKTPVQKVSNTVYEGFLHSYDQKAGLKSYGECVDLLVNYYYPKIK